jgi:hypothetical protein
MYGNLSSSLMQLLKNLEGVWTILEIGSGTFPIDVEVLILPIIKVYKLRLM